MTSSVISSCALLIEASRVSAKKGFNVPKASEWRSTETRDSGGSPPHVFAIAARTSARFSSSAALTLKNSARRPAAAISATIRSALACVDFRSRCTPKMFQPARASASEQASPKPEEAPSTRAQRVWIPADKTARMLARGPRREPPAGRAPAIDSPGRRAMTRYARIAAPAVFLLLQPAARPDAAAAAAAADAGEIARQEIVVTNQDLAVVVETRHADLPAGAVSLGWSNVPASARSETWSLTNAREAGVRMLGLSAPTVSSNSFSDLVGRRVRVERPGGSAADAEVLAVSGPSPEQILFREGGDLVYGEPGARLVRPGAGDAAGRAGRIRLRLESGRAGARDLTARYLVSDIGWQADYALTLAPDEKSGRLEGWFTVDNRTGTPFAPSRLRLLAGTLRTSSAPAPRALAYRTEAMAAPQSVAGSEAVSESRIYEIPAPASLTEGRTTFPLAEDAEVPIDKSYVARGSFWFGEATESQTVPVAVIYKVGAKKLSAALPAGAVRVYTEGGTVFGGESRIAHTPERTDFEIETSEAFDLTARRRQTSFTQVGPRETESAWEVTLSSRKKEAATVLVRDTFPGDWKLLESSVPSTKVSARLVEFPVPVPAGGESKLTYRVRVRVGG